MNATTEARPRATSPARLSDFPALLQTASIYLGKAHDLDEAGDVNFTQRLTGMAKQRLEQIRGSMPPDAEGAVHALFDIEALMVAAHDVRDASEARRTLLMPALRAMDHATDVLMTEAGSGSPRGPTGPDEPSAASAPQAPEPQRSMAERKAYWALSSISNLVEAARVLCVDIIDDGEDSWDYTVHKVVAARELCTQAGMIADVGIGDLGRPYDRRHLDALGWLMPPAYHALDNEKTGGAA
jgi:hypothetical protein